MTTELTYDEKAALMTKDAKRLFKSQLVERFSELKTCAATAQASTIDGVNAAREIGELIQGYTGHEKLLTNEFNQLALCLPDVGIDFAKECLSIRHALAEPVTDYADAKPIWDKLLVQLELLPKSKRELAQSTPPAFEPIEDFLCEVASLASKYAKLEKTTPVESWKPYYRTTFLNEFKRLEVIREKIIAIV